MEVKKTFLVLADISGYTRFVKYHKVSLIHAERIIIELLESVIKQAKYPLVLHELLGDAVTFYAVSDGSRTMALDIWRQVNKFFEAFQLKENELVSGCSMCRCDACSRAGQLRLKAIVHHGEAVFTRVRHFEKVAGEDVILAHRLLKNSIDKDEYILMSESFDEVAGEIDGTEPERYCEDCEGIGQVNVAVYSPMAINDDLPPYESSIWHKLRFHLKHDVYLVKRLFFKPSRRFNNLEN